MNAVLAICLTILAQAANGGNAPDAAPDPAADPGGGGIWTLMLPFAVIAILFHLMISRPQKRDKARRDEMLNTLKKNDPVVTIGGIIGTVVSVSEDGSEVVVRVDDNSRLKFRHDAIREVIQKDDAGADDKK